MKRTPDTCSTISCRLSDRLNNSELMNLSLWRRPHLSRHGGCSGGCVELCLRCGLLSLLRCLLLLLLLLQGCTGLFSHTHT